MKLRTLLKIPPGYYQKLATVESSGDPNAVAPVGSASGQYQFIESTWKNLVKEMGKDYTLKDRFDVEKSQEVVEYFTKQNEKYLKNKLGRDPNEAELYLAHFSGMGGANKLLEKLKENPHADSSEIYSEKAIKNNPHLKGKKAYEVYNWAAKKFGIDNYSLPKEKTERTKYIEYPIKEIDNTYVATNKIPKFATQPINPTYTSLPKDEKVTESKGINEKQLRDLLEKERQTTEQKFLNVFKQKQTPQEQYTQPQQEDLSYLYNYIKLDD